MNKRNASKPLRKPTPSYLPELHMTIPCRCVRPNVASFGPFTVVALLAECGFTLTEEPRAYDDQGVPMIDLKALAPSAPPVEWAGAVARFVQASGVPYLDLEVGACWQN